MARKRNTGSDPVTSAGAAPARAKANVTHKHKSAVPETTADAVAASPASELPAPVPEASPIINSTSEVALETAPTAATEAPKAEITGPSFEEVATLAYSFWEARGYQGGSPDEDWARAEYELHHFFATAPRG